MEILKLRQLFDGRKLKKNSSIRAGLHLSFKQNQLWRIDLRNNSHLAMTDNVTLEIATSALTLISERSNTLINTLIT